MEEQQRLSHLLYLIFVSRNIHYNQVKYYPEEQLNLLFDDCSFAVLDECMDLLGNIEHYEGCAALKLIVDAKLQQQSEELFAAFMSVR